MHSAFVRVLTILVAVSTVLSLLPPNVAHGDNARYKEHIKRAKAHAALDQFDKAAGEFLAAYEIDPKPALLFNAAHAFWLADMHDEALEQYRRYLKAEPSGSASAQARSRFFEAAELKWQDQQLAAALELYQAYIDLAPTAAERNVATSRQRFFEAAEAFWKRGERDAAEPHYQRFVAFGGTGADIDTAHARLRELEEERARAADARAKADARVREATRDAHQDALERAETGDERSDAGNGRQGNKIAFFSTAGLVLVGAVSAGINAARVGSAEQDKIDAIEQYRELTGQSDAWSSGGNACALAEIDPFAAAQPIVVACDKGKQAALLANLSLGVAAVSLAAAGFFFYKAYLQDGDERETGTATLVPSISADGVGASLLMRF